MITKSRNAIRTLTLVCLLVTIVVSAGCGKKESGSSLSEQYAKAMQIPGDEARARRLAVVGARQLEAKDNSGAEASFDAAREAAALVEDPEQQAGVYITLAINQAGGPSKEPTRNAMNNAKEAIERITNVEAKAERLADLGELQFRFVADKDVAFGTVRSAEKLIPEVPDVEGKVAVMGKVAGSYLKIKKDDEADRVLRSATDITAGIESPSEKIRALIAVARAQNAAYQKKAALATLVQASDVAGTIEGDATLAGLRRLDIADALKDLGEPGMAQKQIDQAQDLATGPGAGSTAQEVIDRIRRMEN